MSFNKSNLKNNAYSNNKLNNSSIISSAGNNILNHKIYDGSPLGNQQSQIINRFADNIKLSINKKSRIQSSITNIKENKEYSDEKRLVKELTQGNQITNKIKDFETRMIKNFDLKVDNGNDSDSDKDVYQDYEKCDFVPIPKETLIIKLINMQKYLNNKLNEIKLLQNRISDMQLRHVEFLSNFGNNSNNSSNPSILDKKLVELSKANIDLHSKNEGLRTANANLLKAMDNLEDTAIYKNKTNNDISYHLEESHRKNPEKIHNLQQKVVTLRNKLQQSNDENIKLLNLLKREVGENIDFNQLMKEKTEWKGRAEAINLMKNRIEHLKQQKSLQINNNTNINPNNINDNNTISNINPNNLNNISSKIQPTNQILDSTIQNDNNLPNVQPVLITQNQLNHSNISNIHNTSINPGKISPQHEKFNIYHYPKTPVTNKILLNDKAGQAEIEKLNEELTQFKSERTKLKARAGTLSGEMEIMKSDYLNKMRVLIQKSDNDEKIIKFLSNEIEKYKSNNNNNNNNNSNNKYLEYNQEDISFNYKQEVVKLKKEIEEKKATIDNQNLILKDPNNKYSQEELITKLKILEDENTNLKGQSEAGSIYEALAKDNAKLRLKIRMFEDVK